MAEYRYTTVGGDARISIARAVNAVEDAGFPELTNTGVSFAYTDTDVLNSLPYFYAVTAFDVNSIASGPGTLERLAGMCKLTGIRVSVSKAGEKSG